ncbi:MAG TPA: DUF1178 family protein [Rhodospirillales bacterium]|jgi:hypothetical protein|nr:DUF1178 family protein [Rhodospirillales bacterium]HJO68946.1 DUF1178 family protein [Rhodospirillales bacterium]
MIVFQLACAQGHEFETWFRDGATYDREARARRIECPHCGDTKVIKAPMAPHVAKRSARREVAEMRAREVAKKYVQAAEKVREHVEANCDYVGPEFAEEARRIHYGETEKRGIYGEATDGEANELSDEGIEYHRVPWAQRKTH